MNAPGHNSVAARRQTAIPNLAQQEGQRMFELLSRQHADPAPKMPVPLDSPTRTSECRKKLRWMLQAPPENNAIAMDITPEMAEAMLECNSSDEWRNRPQSQRGLDRYVAAMKKGWRFTGEPIIFSASGRLLNGQHRLEACRRAGTVFRSMIVFGIADDAFKFMDIGVTRSAGHIFSIEGIENANLVAGMTRIIRSYYSSVAWSGAVMETESDELLDFYRGREDIQLSCHSARAVSREGLLSPRWAGAMHYICAAKSRSNADTFFEAIISGVGFKAKNDPAYVVRQRMLKNQRAASSDREADLYLAAYLALGWNAWRANSTMGLVKWRTAQSPGQAFPRVQ